MQTLPDTARTDALGLSGAGGRPVLLATIGVPLDERAAAFAIDTALECGSQLIIVNVTRLEPLSLSMILGYDALEEFTPEVSSSLRSRAELAASLGVDVTRLRVRSPRPVEALLVLLRERSPGLLVFGPDRRSLSSRRLARSVRVLRARAPCLVWAPI